MRLPEKYKTHQVTRIKETPSKSDRSMNVFLIEHVHASIFEQQHQMSLKNEVRHGFMEEEDTFMAEGGLSWTPFMTFELFLLSFILKKNQSFKSLNGKCLYVYIEL